jgi:hypothetical protein
MIRKRSGWNIVLAGFWNRMIFTPEWVIPRLFPEPQLETLVALLPVLPLIYRVDQVALEVTMTRLAFRPRKPGDDASLLRAEKMARTVLQALPETPVQAVGVNFSFKDKNPAPPLVSMFNDTDDAELAAQDWSIGERKITRKLTRGGQMLNLTMTYTAGVVQFDFNFHSAATTGAEALAAVAEGKVLAHRDAALKLLGEAYHLESLDGDEDEGDD